MYAFARNFNLIKASLKEGKGTGVFKTIPIPENFGIKRLSKQFIQKENMVQKRRNGRDILAQVPKKWEFRTKNPENIHLSKLKFIFGWQFFLGYEWKKFATKIEFTVHCSAFWNFSNTENVVPSFWKYLYLNYEAKFYADKW